MVQFSSPFFSPFPSAEKKENGEGKSFSFSSSSSSRRRWRTNSPFPTFSFSSSFFGADLKKDPFLVQADHIHALHDTQNATKKDFLEQKRKRVKRPFHFSRAIFPSFSPPSSVLMMRPLSSLLRRGGLSRPLGFRARPPINAFFPSFFFPNAISSAGSSNLFPFFFFPAAFFAFSVFFSSFCAKVEAAGGGRGLLLFPRKGKQEGG